MISTLSFRIKNWEIRLEAGKNGLKRVVLGKHRTFCRSRQTGTPVKFLERAEKQLKEYFLGKRRKFSCRLDLTETTLFRRRVFFETMRIPYGRFRTYGQIARKINKSGAGRAVGQALAANPFPVLVPCHRVLGANGRLTGFSAGLKKKKMLLELEKCS